MKTYKYNMKSEFEARMRKLLSDKEDYQKFSEIIHKQPENFIRANTIKISPQDLVKRLSKKWQVEQPFPSNPEIILIKSALKPGELGKAEEHLLGYYYVQELSSMLSILALNPLPNQSFLDLCASPGSKTTQAASKMENTGLIIANDKDIGRISILSANLERCGIANTIITRMQGENLCSRLLNKVEFDKILVDAPCSGEGTLRSNPETFNIWNINMIKQLSALQKKLLFSAIELLKENGELVYSTCTHAPEENEEVIDSALKKFPELELETIFLPVKTRPGIAEWNNKKYNKQMLKCARIYPQDNNSEGFFIAKLKWRKNYDK